jgi:hypothetical protein
MGRPTKYRPEIVDAFFQGLSRCGIVKDGLEEVPKVIDGESLARETVQKWRRDPSKKEFAERWEAALEDGRDNLRRMLWSLALGRIEKKRGHVIAPNVAIFLAKITLPEYKALVNTYQEDKLTPAILADALAQFSRGVTEKSPLTPNAKLNGGRNGGNGKK